ncbi:LysE family translocator [Phytohabitans flavus]|uniref:LysE family translocator n=1 Tax=Phytohabitans flavus TaxID=1076124 RepID=UPI003CD05F93
MSAIIATSAEIFTIVRLAGVAWLLWLAWKAFRSRAEGTLANMTVEQQDRRGVWAAFRNGLVVGALNPKTAVFFLTPTPPSPPAAPTNPRPRRRRRLLRPRHIRTRRHRPIRLTTSTPASTHPASPVDVVLSLMGESQRVAGAVDASVRVRSGSGDTAFAGLRVLGSCGGLLRFEKARLALMYGDGRDACEGERRAHREHGWQAPERVGGDSGRIREPADAQGPYAERRDPVRSGRSSGARVQRRGQFERRKATDDEDRHGDAGVPLPDEHGDHDAQGEHCRAPAQRGQHGG